jgi:chloramphenicol 3-O-phosphotransferase
VPRSVYNLWHEAQISHRGIAPPQTIYDAILAGGGGVGRDSLATALQETTTWELIDLLVDKVLDGRSLHGLISKLHREGAIRRADLVEWSEVFT